MALFLGFLNIGEKAGAVNFLSRIIGPFFSKLFPEVPRNHPSMGHMVMNFSANMLGLDNAATPFGLKAMKSLQELNPVKGSGLQCADHVHGAACIGTDPYTCKHHCPAGHSEIERPDQYFYSLYDRHVCGDGRGADRGCHQTKDQFVPARHFIMDWRDFRTDRRACLFSASAHTVYSIRFPKIFSNGLIILLFVVFHHGRMDKADECIRIFHRRGEEGFQVAVTIIPYLVAMLVAISVSAVAACLILLPAASDLFFTGAGHQYRFCAGTADGPDAPAERSCGQGNDDYAMKQYGPDSFVGKLSCIFQGTTDSTFYIVALYFGSVGISKDSIYHSGFTAGGSVGDRYGDIDFVFFFHA